jgi:hypothetical protein
MMDILTDLNGEVITDSGGVVYYGRNNPINKLRDETDTFIRKGTDNRTAFILAYDSLINELKVDDKIDNFRGIWPVSMRNTDAYLKSIVGSDLVSSGDHTTSTVGISGAGSYYFNTGVNPGGGSIDDFNNWAMGIYSQTDSDAAVYDMGVSIGSNEHYIQCSNASGDMVVKNGTTTVSGAVRSGSGHFIMSCRNGVVNAYWGTESIGTPSSASGSLASGDIWIGGLNDDSVLTGASSRTYSFAWVYNGEHDFNLIATIDRAVQSLNIIQNRTT